MARGSTLNPDSMITLAARNICWHTRERQQAEDEHGFEHVEELEIVQERHGKLLPIDII